MQQFWSLMSTMHRSRRQVVLVAVVLLAVLAGGLATRAVFVCSPSSKTVRPPKPTATGTLAPSPTQTPGRALIPVSGIVSIHMLNATMGWAVTAEHHILRTTDGTTHCQDVTPPGIDPPQPSPSPNLLADFLSPSMAWVASFLLDATGADFTSSGTTKLFRTSDGGQTWSSTTRQGDVPSQLDFVTSQQGWMASLGGVTEGLVFEDIFRTSDGGATWAKVAQAGPVTGEPPGTLPAGGYSGIGARDAATAWATSAFSGQSGFVWLYVTHDGGATWRHQSLPIPSSIASHSFFQVWTWPPSFFNQQEGILPVAFATGATSSTVSAMVYATHDGGASWQGTSFLPQFAFSAGLDFLTVNQGWATDGFTLLVTSDSGHHWTHLPADPHFQVVTALTFVTSKVGWAISNLHSGRTTLLQTTDGGRTWTALQAP